MHCLHRFYIDLAKKVVEKRRADGNERDFHDVLAVMMRAKETNAYMTDGIIFNTLMQFFTDG